MSRSQCEAIRLLAAPCWIGNKQREWHEGRPVLPCFAGRQRGKGALLEASRQPSPLISVGVGVGVGSWFISPLQVHTQYLSPPRAVSSVPVNPGLAWLRSPRRDACFWLSSSWDLSLLTCKSTGGGRGCTTVLSSFLSAPASLSPEIHKMPSLCSSADSLQGTRASRCREPALGQSPRRHGQDMQVIGPELAQRPARA